MRKPTWPKPKDKRGYTDKELGAICAKLGVNLSRFNEAMGVNTAMMGKDGTIYWYQCDVERALALCLGYRKVYHVEID